MRDAFGQPRMLAAATTTVLMALVVSRAPGAAAQGAKGTLKSACANMNPICLGPKAFEHAHRKQCKNAIHFAAVFPMSRRNCIEGVQAAAAAQQAVQDINTNGGIVDHKILGSGAQHVGHCLVLHTRDSQDDPGMALAEVDKFMKFGAWEQYAHIDAVIGGFSSPVSEAVQQLVQWSSIPQVSYGSTSPHFADKVLNPTFSRTVPSADVLVNGIVRLVQTLEWEFITVLTSDDEYGTTGAKLIRNAVSGLHNSRLKIVATKSFNKGSIGDILEELKGEPGRVVLLHASVSDVGAAFSAARAKGMLGEGWTWIGTDWAQDSLFEEFTVDGAELNKLKDEMKGIVAMRPAVDLTAVSSHVHRRIFALERNISRDMALCPHVGDATAVNTVAYFAYDAVLVAATAVSRAIAKYGEAAASNFTAVLGEVRGMGSNPVKDGATGNIVLDANGDRAMPYALVNLRDVGKWEIVGEYKAGGPLKLFGDDDDSKVITWPDGSTEIPADREERHTSTAALYLFLFLTFIVLSICVGNFLHSHHFYYLPESGAVVILGLIFGAGLRQMSGATHYQHTLIEMTEFDTELFTLVLLPVIIFSAGFNLKKADLMRNFTPILLTAFIGTAISTLVVAGAVYHLGNEGHFEFGKFTGPESLAFGALVSAVDPVATLAVFGALGVETNLNMRVFGESVLNDGVSIVLFRVFTGFFTEEVNNESIMAGVGMFLYIVIGSVFAGAFTAILVAIVLKHASMHSHVLEAGIVILGSYMAFAGAEALGMSGIIASLFCGIGMNHWTYHNFTYDGEVLARRSIRMFSLLADTVIFFQVGQNIVVNVVNPDWTLIGATLVACLIGRMCNIFPLCNLYNLFVSAPHRVSLKDQIVMVHAGLRGAIAFALALTFPSHNIHIVLNTTMWVILFTIFVMGGTCVPMLRMLNVDMGVKSNEVGDSKLSRHSRELTSCMQKVDRLGILPIVTWRFTYDGADTYIENPHEARALRKGKVWDGDSHGEKVIEPYEPGLENLLQQYSNVKITSRTSD